MKHKVKIKVPVEKRGLLGFKKTVMETRTIEVDGKTYPLVKLEITSSSHPFFTGKQKLVDTAGRVDKFYSRYGERKKK